MKIRLLAVLFFVAVSAASVHSFDTRQQLGAAASSKIDRWVFEQSAVTGEVEFLVVLADQADLSHADELATREEKGPFVYRTLYDKAQSTQKPILDWLAANGIEHQSFYIVNMIW